MTKTRVFEPAAHNGIRIGTAYSSHITEGTRFLNLLAVTNLKYLWLLFAEMPLKAPYLLGNSQPFSTTWRENSTEESKYISFILIFQ